jgi:hypothetical protein
MIRFIFTFFSFFLFVSTIWAEDKSQDSTIVYTPIQTHWTALGGMQYLQNNKVLSGPELKMVISSLNDSQASTLLNQSESDETLGFFGLGGSVALSVTSLFFPDTIIHVAGLNISTPYMPLAVPGAVLGIVGGLLELDSITEKYASVQRYNHVTNQCDSVTWNLSPQEDGLALRLSYAF